MLQSCEGIGAVTAAKICTGWAAGRGTRDAEKFLHDMGLTMAQAHQVLHTPATCSLRQVIHDRPLHDCTQTPCA